LSVPLLVGGSGGDLAHTRNGGQRQSEFDFGLGYFREKAGLMAKIAKACFLLAWEILSNPSWYQRFYFQPQ
jgi:hypothetical protein